MKTHLTPEIIADLQERNTTFATCWRIERTDGTLILGTEHDQDIEVEVDSPSGTLQGIYHAQTGITGSTVRSAGDLGVGEVWRGGHAQTRESSGLRTPLAPTVATCV